MIIKPNFKNIKYFIGLFIALGVLFIFAGIACKQIPLIIIGLLAPLGFLIVKLKMKIILTEERIEYYGLFKRFSLTWKEIIKISPMEKYGYPIDRLWDGFYEFQTEKSNKWNSKKIHFLFFSGDTFKEIENRINRKP